MTTTQRTDSTETPAAGKGFRGVYTAIITPFTKTEAIDWCALERIVNLQLAAGVAGIVPCGTTGEAPTLTHAEQLEVIRKVVRWVDGQVQVIAGTGSNNTAHAVELSKEAEQLGADACLVVNPYYNKPTQEGLFRHFKAVADAVSIPVVVYNIRGRTGVNIETDTLLRILSACPNVTADKEASGDIAQMKDVIARAPKSFSVLSGDDSMTLQLLREGGDGIISVASNLVPHELVRMVDLALAGKFDEAAQIDAALAPLVEGLFIETNPIPLKAACAMQGLCQEVYRLPMCEISAHNRIRLQTILSDLEHGNLEDGAPLLSGAGESADGSPSAKLLANSAR